MYEGFFVNGVKDGEGSYKSNNGIQYKGEYKNGQKSGNGRIINEDGSVAYEGSFVNGLPHGQGWVVTKDGVKAEGIWKEGIDAKLCNWTKMIVLSICIKINSIR